MEMFLECDKHEDTWNPAKAQGHKKIPGCGNWLSQSFKGKNALCPRNSALWETEIKNRPLRSGTPRLGLLCPFREDLGQHA